MIIIKNNSPSVVTRRGFMKKSALSGMALLATDWLPGSVWGQRGTNSAGAAEGPEFSRRGELLLRQLGKLNSTDYWSAFQKRDQQLSGGTEGGQAARLERYLDELAIIFVTLDKHGVGTSQLGPAKRELFEAGWNCFLVRVQNPLGLTGSLILLDQFGFANRPIEGELVRGIHGDTGMGTGMFNIRRNGAGQKVPSVDEDWLGYRFGAGLNGVVNLRGEAMEYEILQLFSQRNTSASAKLMIGTSDIPGSRGAECRGVDASFTIQPAAEVTLQILDSDGQTATASMIIRDANGRLYPVPAHRMEPDLGYQPQIYRASNESLKLSAGEYKVKVWRGPEYIPVEQSLRIADHESKSSLSIQLNRWVNPGARGWVSGDPHIHPEGQRFGDVSLLGLQPETMLRQCRGEGLDVGCVLIWAGGYYYEKQFLTGQVFKPSGEQPFPEDQALNNSTLKYRKAAHDDDSIVRYDIEQAGFPFQQDYLGHPIYLGLKNHDYPGVPNVYDWPSYNLPIFQWARAQGAVTGYGHAGLGFDAPDLPPSFDVSETLLWGGAEAIVNITHGVIDFITGAMLHPRKELQLWYHLLNCGFAIAMIGETDFQTGLARVGCGRTYVRVDSAREPDERFRGWIDGIRANRTYFGDGHSHIFDLAVNGVEQGVIPVQLADADKVTVTAKVAAWLDETPVDPDDDHDTNGYTYWHLERARIGRSRDVLVEVVVNGVARASKQITADGSLDDLSFDLHIAESSWIAIRILPSVHTSAIQVQVGGRPVRTSKRSAQWLVDVMDALWKAAEPRIRPEDRAGALEAWNHARATYRKIKEESSAG